METARRWLDTVEPFVLPVLKFLGPFLLRYVFTKYLARRRKRELTRRQYLIIWSMVFAARGLVHRRRRRPRTPLIQPSIG